MTASTERRPIRTYSDLEVFQRSMRMLKPIHRIVLKFPDYERFDLANQLRRAAKSVPANIAEGYGKRRSAKEFQAFLTNAMGSAMEIEVHLQIALELEYIDQAEFDYLSEEYKVIGRQLYKLIEHWRTFDSRPPTSDFRVPAS
jgi:four helix bundle protein